MQNLEKVAIHGAKDLRHGDVYLRLGLVLASMFADNLMREFLEHQFGNVRCATSARRPLLLKQLIAQHRYRRSSF